MDGVVLPCVFDRFNGVLVDLSEEVSVEVDVEVDPCAGEEVHEDEEARGRKKDVLRRVVEDAELFKASLELSLKTWEEEGRRGVWLTIPLRLAALASVAGELGFEFHRALGSSCTMNKWLPKEEKNVLPLYPMTSMGVGGLTVNAKREVLVVQELYSTLDDYWKLPGGGVDPREDLSTAVQREVLEETSVKATFQSIVAFRHLLQFRWGTGDMFFVCVLRADDDDAVPHAEADEIKAVKWIPLEEFLAMPKLERWIKCMETQIRREVDRVLGGDTVLVSEADPAQPAETVSAALVPVEVANSHKGSSLMYCVGGPDGGCKL